MKMPENMTCWPPFSRQRNKASGQSLRLQWRTCGRYNVVRYKTAIDATMQPLSPLVHRGLSDFAGLYSNLAYITSVFIGYIGTDSIGSFIKRFAAKKAGVEDGRNQ